MTTMRIGCRLFVGLAILASPLSTWTSARPAVAHATSATPGASGQGRTGTGGRRGDSTGEMGGTTGGSETAPGVVSTGTLRVIGTGGAAGGPGPLSGPTGR